MNGSRHWKRGDHIVVRDVHRGVIRSAAPVTVVEDSDARTILHLAIGTPFCLPADEDGRLTKDPRRFARLKELVWEGFEQLLLARPGEAHAVIVRWAGPERRFVEWYVNLQAPLRRTTLGFDSTDHVLDVVISSDFGRVRWKDEDQFARDGPGRLLHRKRCGAIPFRGRARRWPRAPAEPPFSENWAAWTPDPTWTIPQLPAGWDELW